MYQLMRVEQVIAESLEEIIYDEQEKGWRIPPNLYCDTYKEMHVIFVDVPKPDGGPDVIL